MFPEHPIMSYETIEIKMAAIFAKRSVKVTFHGMYNEMQPFSSQSQQFSCERFVVNKFSLLFVRTRMIEFVVSLCYFLSLSEFLIGSETRLRSYNRTLSFSFIEV